MIEFSSQLRRKNDLIFKELSARQLLLCSVINNSFYLNL